MNQCWLGIRDYTNPDPHRGYKPVLRVHNHGSEKIETDI
jgi:hypothetical protein